MRSISLWFFICISLAANDVELHVLIGHYLSLEKWLLKSYAHFLIRLLFLLLSCSPSHYFYVPEFFGSSYD